MPTNFKCVYYCVDTIFEQITKNILKNLKNSTTGLSMAASNDCIVNHYKIRNRLKSSFKSESFHIYMSGPVRSNFHFNLDQYSCRSHITKSKTSLMANFSVKTNRLKLYCSAFNGLSLSLSPTLPLSFCSVVFVKNNYTIEIRLSPIIQKKEKNENEKLEITMP